MRVWGSPFAVTKPDGKMRRAVGVATAGGWRLEAVNIRTQPMLIVSHYCSLQKVIHFFSFRLQTPAELKPSTVKSAVKRTGKT